MYFVMYMKYFSMKGRLKERIHTEYTGYDFFSYENLKYTLNLIKPQTQTEYAMTLIFRFAQ